MKRGKPKRALRIQVTLTPQMDTAIDALLATGLFGWTRSDLVHRLVCDRLIALTQEGWCK
jgi:Arc/MetJ-type ribon-helix-helix transcriptional regulator